MEKSEVPLSSWVPRGQKLFLFTITILSMVHPTTLGYDSLMVSGILNLESYLSFFSLTPATIGLNTAAVWMGQVVACITCTQYVNDRFGRKKSILTGIIILTIGVILQSASQNIGMFLAGRAILGFGGSFTNISGIVLLAELCPINKRGFLMGLAFSCFLVGALISSGVTYGVRNAPGNWNWRIPSIVQLAPNLVALINLMFLPESPKFLVLKGYTRKAFDILMIVNNSDEEKSRQALMDFKVELEVEQPENIGFRPWLQFFKSRINVHRALISFTHAILTEMAGSSVGTYYLAILLEQAGISSTEERLQVNIVMSAWQLVCATLGSLMFDRIGRKLQAMVSLSGMVVCFMILGGLVKTFGDGHSRSGSFGTIAVMFMFSGFYSFTFTPLTTLYPSELYPFKMRSAGTSLYTVFNGLFGLISSFVLPIAMSNIGWKYYIVNASYDIIFIPIIYYYWMETKGADIEFIDEKFWEHPLNIKHSPQVIEALETESSVERESFEVQKKV